MKQAMTCDNGCGSVTKIGRSEERERESEEKLETHTRTAGEVNAAT